MPHQPPATKTIRPLHHKNHFHSLIATKTNISTTLPVLVVVVGDLVTSLDLTDLADNNNCNMDGDKDGTGTGTQEPIMGSIGPECTPLKVAYDTCFNTWFADKFLKGHPGLDSCDELLKSYTNCVKKALKARNVDLEEISMDHLGTDRERQKPPSS